MDSTPIPEKPVAEVWRPDWIKLPKITLWRRIARFLLRQVSRLLLFTITRVSVEGMEHFPRRGPALVVFNHLGDGDLVAMMGLMPVYLDYMAKIDLPEDMPLIAKLAKAYGVVFVHRGKPDLRALRVALDALAEGRLLGVAPEARYSLTGALEKGTDGAAFVALRSGAPVVPVALVGTENRNLYPNLKRFRRPRIRVIVGEPFHLTIGEQENRRAAIRRGTEEIMCALARLLPPSYRGVYAYCVDPED